MSHNLLKVFFFGLFTIVLAVVVHWLVQPSDYKEPPNSGSHPGMATQTEPEPIPIIPELLVSESRETPSSPTTPSSIQDDSAVKKNADSVDNDTATNCLDLTSLLIPPGLADIPAHLPFPFDYSPYNSDSALLKRAQANDGYAQQEYANRLYLRHVSELIKHRGNFTQPEDKERWLQQSDRMEEFAIKAVQNRSARSTMILGESRLFGPNEDQIIAAAWLLIGQRMGTTGFASLRSQGSLKLTEEQIETSELLALHFIEEYDLWFLKPEPSAELTKAKLRNVRNRICLLQ